MARFYSNENIALQVVVELQLLGHDVLTSLDAGKANAAVPDDEVLAFAVADNRILLTNNRRHFFSSIAANMATMRESSFAPLTRISAARHSESMLPLALPLK